MPNEEEKNTATGMRLTFNREKYTRKTEEEMDNECGNGEKESKIR